MNLEKPFFVLAPMEDVTDFVFREIVSKYLPKPSALFTEFTNVEALNSKGFDKTIQRFKFSKIQKPIVAQIWGIKPENYYKASKLIESLGFNGVDINMGCPDRKVMKIGACSALIENKNLAKEIIAATKEGVKNIPVSVKTRIGTKEIVTQDWISFLLEQKISTLTVHGRLAKDLSKFPANWSEIKKAVGIRDKISPNTIIIGNGDVSSYNDGLQKARDYKVDGLMIGRGIFSNPWAFEKDKKNHSIKERVELAIKHVNLFKKIYGESKSDILKKFLKMYIKDFPDASELRNLLMGGKTTHQMIEVLKNFKMKEDQEASLSQLV